ncbi:Phosphomethylpyrimidine kinase [Propionibacterium freudenreichii subsp. freudenreichii]|nr:bifunctional hydroxymethylpyrimidine kinase/phosphomethylpyrimidine kinase [Propionibacterium freudenreichii]AJQ90038.1 Phosphomethylpyrimidine kinase [Propionibacterium freudenreichii subsp. freudenreichii]CEG91334.1 Phosphomethylpyrimidine kinase/ hydroxymethylpyrimidine phosphokinase [Propionibacterium freudenreichii]
MMSTPPAPDTTAPSGATAATRPPVALTIAGSDSSGGAGIQADLKSFSALGAYGMSVIVALTAQNTTGVTGVLATPPEFVTAQLDAVTSDIRLDAVKVGMLASAELATTVRDGLAALRAATPDLPIVVDPVMVATSGAHLLPDDAVEALRGVLRHASLITPNLPEAAVLLDEPQANSVDEMIGQATRLLELGPERVLVKGGHGHGAESVDVLASADDVQVLHAPRIDTVNTHGTGCSLSSAIAALRPQRDSWDAAVRDAKDWLSGAIAHADALDIGAGGGPVHHFYRWW